MSEQIVNISAAVPATDEPGYPSTVRKALIPAPPPPQLPESLIAEAQAMAAQGGRPGWSARRDGWTRERVRIFLEAIAQGATIAGAAAAAGMSKASAYAFRNSARGRAFNVGWDAAYLLARRQLADEVMSRALHGCVDVLTRGGEIVGERHRHDNRLAMAVLTRLDKFAASRTQADEAAILAAEEFDAFIDAIGAGNEAAADFLQSRSALPWQQYEEASIMRRSEDYARGADGTEEEDPSLSPPPQGEARQLDNGPEQTEARRRLRQAVQDVCRREILDRQTEPRDRDPAARRVRGRQGREAADELSALSEAELISRWNAKVPFMLEVTGLEGELDPDLVRYPIASEEGQSPDSPAVAPSASRAVAVAKEEASAKERTPADGEWQRSTWSTSSNPPDPPRESKTTEAVRRGQLHGEGNRPAQTDGGGVAAEKQPQAVTQSHPPEPVVEWVLGDEGLPVKMVNGKLPPHHVRPANAGVQLLFADPKM
jgi:hypothetical protein